ncbi:MAG: bifunctional phosphoribosyl-AMP cyclohydrolase/phosphoribosyl-ATP diphosphatase HisIE [Nitrospirales bacterium]|nr:bifunctional phosphoribosyl-AMP cyclohydrolase/phosphoribosyl-ATP diphosphatase HisIE [Nitrospirales bacterium]
MKTLQFDEQGLVPAVVQDWRDGSVLMLGYMNQDALTETMNTQFVHFWSRSRKTLWKKGESSEHYLIVKQLYVDCDHDTILVKAEPVGPTCHTGAPSCFFTAITEQGEQDTHASHKAQGGIFDRLYEMTVSRKESPDPNSYVSSLLIGGTDRILKKVVEEAGEVILAAKNDNREEIIYEVADLLFHTMVMLGHCDIPPEEIYQELGKRFGKSGLKKKEGSPS